MNLPIATERLNAVTQTNAIADSHWDFLATHVPFRKIAVSHNLKNEAASQVIDEVSVFNELFDPVALTRHQFAVVTGANGSGKSHFIRWIYSRLQAAENIRTKNAILLIKRNENTLRGTIKQLLEIEQIKHLEGQEVYKRLLSASQVISESKFKSQIFHQFIVELENDQSEELTNQERKGLLALLKNDLFQSRLMKVGGPIDRIYAKVTSSTPNGVDLEEARFKEDDFSLDIDFTQQLKDNQADRRAIQTAEKLLSDYEDEMDSDLPLRYAGHLNQFVDTVIQSQAGIKPGDFEDIFTSIRKELASQGMGLILLIEDITAFTGINQALLNALVTEHTGLNSEDHICRLISIVGTTTQYYSDFRDNYKDRVTAKITLNDDSLGSTDSDLYLFFAKYLNAMSLDDGTLENWYKDGALDNEFPVHQPTEKVQSDFVEFGGKKLSLYPFTKTAIKKLYADYLPSPKTPRAILKQILVQGVLEIINGKTSFMSFCRGEKTGLDNNVDDRISSIIDDLGLSYEQQEALKTRCKSFIAYFGDGTLNATKTSISRIKRDYFTEFGFSLFERAISGTGEDVVSDEEVIVPSPITKPAPHEDPGRKAYDEYALNVSAWKAKKSRLMIMRSVLEPINDFIWNTLNWQQNGIPVAIKEAAKNGSKRLICFERLENANVSGLITLPADDETVRLLLAFGQWLHLGKSSWGFAGGYQQMFTATSWLERHRKEIVDAVVKGVGAPMQIIAQCAIAVDVFQRILSGTIQAEKPGSIKPESLFVPPSQNAPLDGHSQQWKDLEQRLTSKADGQDYHAYLLNYFTLMPPGQTTTAKNRLIRALDFEDAFKDLRKKSFLLPLDGITSQYAEINKILDLYRQTVLRLQTVWEAEKTMIQRCQKSLYDFFNFDPEMGIEIGDDDIREFLGDISDFYEDVNGCSLSIVSKADQAAALRNEAVGLRNKLSLIKTALSSSSFLEGMVAVSSNPMLRLDDMIALFKEVEDDLSSAEQYASSEKQKLLEQGKSWTDGVDPRFQTYKAKLDKKIGDLEEAINA